MESLKREFLDLLDRDVEFRYAVAGYLGLSEALKRLDALAEEQVKLREEQTRLAEEQVRLREEQTKIWEEIKAIREEQTKIWKEIEALREGQARIWEEIARVWKEIKDLREEQIKLREDMREGFESMRRHIDALGARWGIISESAFREGLRGLLEKEFRFKIEKWVRYDSEGFVYGYPSHVDIDVAMRDEKVVLIEVKSHVDKEDVYNFRRKSEFYRIAEGREPTRLIIVTPYADEEAQEIAKQLGIEVFTKV
ncbi:MAG: DUF3782 domain-containing protein [Candidatus Bathyarchaeia archaeon]|nr:DUF3782 domain-containing protein [Candidatus Bathyarchaeota archaeon]